MPGICPRKAVQKEIITEIHQQISINQHTACQSQFAQRGATSWRCSCSKTEAMSKAAKAKEACHMRWFYVIRSTKRNQFKHDLEHDILRSFSLESRMNDQPTSWVSFHTFQVKSFDVFVGSSVLLVTWTGTWKDSFSRWIVLWHRGWSGSPRFFCLHRYFHADKKVDIGWSLCAFFFSIFFCWMESGGGNIWQDDKMTICQHHTTPLDFLAEGAWTRSPCALDNWGHFWALRDVLGTAFFFSVLAVNPFLVHQIPKDESYG